MFVQKVVLFVAVFPAGAFRALFSAAKRAGETGGETYMPQENVRQEVRIAHFITKEG